MNHCFWQECYCFLLQTPCRRFTKLRIFNTFVYKYRQNLVSKITNSDKSQTPQFRETAVGGCTSFPPLNFNFNEVKRFLIAVAIILLAVAIFLLVDWINLNAVTIILLAVVIFLNEVRINLKENTIKLIAEAISFIDVALFLFVVARFLFVVGLNLRFLKLYTFYLCKLRTACSKNWLNVFLYFVGGFY